MFSISDVVLHQLMNFLLPKVLDAGIHIILTINLCLQCGCNQNCGTNSTTRIMDRIKYLTQCSPLSYWSLLMPLFSIEFICSEFIYEALCGPQSSSVLALHILNYFVKLTYYFVSGFFKLMMILCKTMSLYLCLL